MKATRRHLVNCIWFKEYEGSNTYKRELERLNKGDIIIYACVIIGAGIGLALGSALPGVLVGLGIGYRVKWSMKSEN
ncbi:hypothetical protein AWU65_22345 [Paenibacillus glucanolyticus]|uniref:Uncharacterized protein n=1 Tax=Paenibacillus glucanolyticus TaxID=59843 RepID=A0A163LUG1_9BACL|nr:hypothetical protein [Paenibacillus glucanolyticus]KZS48478.1 hypothetical protein AWU65_22345 [Paenibacillus glucanolyticus]